MALVIKDRVRQTSTTAGTGTITLSGSVEGFQGFSVIGSGNTTYYTIADQSGSNWEVGLGTYISPNQLARTTVYESSNSNNLVDFGSNTKDVFVTFPAEAVTSSGVTSVTGTAPVVSSGGSTPVISMAAANTSTNGYLTSTDWNTFNGKGAGTITGSGTTNYVPKLTSSTAIGNSQIYDNGTNVGVGYTTNYDKLQVNGSISSQSGGYFGFWRNGLTANTAALDGVTITLFGVSSGVATGRSDASAWLAGVDGIRFVTATSERMRIDGSGNVGIGLTNPSVKLDVSGAINGTTITASTAFAGPHNGTVGATTPDAGAFTTLSASSTVSGAGFSNYLASPPAIGGTIPAAGTFTALSATSVANTSSIARAGGKTSVTSILNQNVFTTGGTTLASQTAATNSTWRIRAFGTFTAINNATARTAQVAVFWNATQLGAITPSVLVSTAQTTQWQVEFTVTASSTTAVWTAGTLLSRIASATALAVDTVTPASTTVTAGSQTIDLRFRVSSAVASEGWNVQSVIIERLV